MSGHTGIYNAQRVGQGKHRGELPESVRLGEVKQYRAQARSTEKDKE